jgi:hypothetical protein
MMAMAIVGGRGEGLASARQRASYFGGKNTAGTAPLPPKYREAAERVFRIVRSAKAEYSAARVAARQ